LMLNGYRVKTSGSANKCRRANTDTVLPFNVFDPQGDMDRPGWEQYAPIRGYSRGSICLSASCRNCLNLNGYQAADGDGRPVCRCQVMV
jgi:hypothetical protein